MGRQHFSRILVVLEESELAICTARLGVDLAAQLGAGLLFHIAMPTEAVDASGAIALNYALRERDEVSRQRAAPWFDQALAMAAAATVPAETVLTLDEAPCAAVLRIAESHHCDLVVAGSHGRGALGRALHGSLAADLIRLSPLPVLLCREDMREAAVVEA